jgi:hypothetical protein
MSHPRLQPIDDGLWCINSHFRVWGCSGSVRMTIVRTPAGLVLYSPVRLDREAIREIESLGRVTAIIAPNLFHHLFLRACAAAFPDARVLVPDGLAAKIGLIAPAEVMTERTVIGAGDDIGLRVCRGHTLRETILIHRPTRTLITADLIYNIASEQTFAERAVFRAIGCYGAPGVAFYHAFAITDRAAIRQLVDDVARWRVRRIIMCHGGIIERDDAAAVFAAAWAPFLR